MDREIPKEVRTKERNKRIIKYGGIGGGCVVLLIVLISLMRSSVKEKDLVFSEVSQGTIEVSVSASGKVVPAFEEIINSPINTRILEVYKKGGDSVDVGQEAVGRGADETVPVGAVEGEQQYVPE